MEYELLSKAGEAILILADVKRLMFLASGVLIGLAIGVIPGLGGIVGMALLLPFTFDMDPYSAFALLLGMGSVTTTSDTIPAVLFGVPGTAGSAATILDGHPLAKQGQAGRAFGAAYTASMIGGIIGGKIFHLLEYPHTFLADPVGAVFSGYGLAWYGGFLGAAAAVLFTLNRHDALGWSILDAIAPAIAVGYFFGRGGCELSGDGCYGVPTDLPWGKTYPNGTIPTLDHVHPTPIYEMLQMVCIFGILWALRGRLKSGQAFGLYLVLMAIARFAVEFVRRTPEVLLGLSVHQWVSLALIIAGVYLIAIRQRAEAGQAP